MTEKESETEETQTEDSEEKKVEEEKEEDSELEEIIDEEKLKELTEEIEKESGRTFFENSFTDFVQVDSEDFLPTSLEQVAEGTDSLRGIFFAAGGVRGDENREQANYSLNEYESKETKYGETPKTFHEEISAGTPPNVGLAIDSLNRNPNGVVLNTPESQRMERDLIHNPESDYAQPRRFDFGDNKMPFERRDKKYKEFKPKQ